MPPARVFDINGKESFCFFLQKEALAFYWRAAAPPAPRAVLF
jgi:hypothetical protein